MEAVKFCNDRNQRLLEVKSEEEQVSISSMVGKSSHIWLGASNVVGTRYFKWLDGQPLTYENWCYGHPHKSRYQHDGIVLFNGKWYDHKVSNSFTVICESSQPEVEADILIEQSYIDQVWRVANFSFLDKEYVLYKERKTFHEAAEICSNLNGSLAKIGSKAENDYISNTIVDPVQYWTWIGASNAAGTFKWLGDSSEMIYSNWKYADEPRRDIETLIGVVMTIGGKWDNRIVSEDHYVLCERVNVLQLQSNQSEPFKPTTKHSEAKKRNNWWANLVDLLQLLVFKLN